jgi:hypothetical protein
MSGSSVTQNSGSIVLHSGSLALVATGGDVAVNGTLKVSGLSPTFYNLTKFTNGGQVALTSTTGNITVGSTGLIDVSAASGVGTVDSGAGNGGSVTVTAAGVFTPGGQIKGGAGKVTDASTGAVIAQGTGGAFSLDVGSLDSSGAGNGLLSSVESGLTGFGQQTIRDRNDLIVTVDGTSSKNSTIKADSFDLSADKGSITVTGTIDASNVAATDSAGKAIQVGGTIDLEAYGSVDLTSTAVLNASGQNFSNAGKGGTVTLAAGSEANGQFSTGAFVNIESGSTIDLSVAGNSSTSAAAGDFTGTLHIRAPQLADGSDLQVNPINGNILNASAIVVEGYKIYVPSGGLIDSVEGTVYGDAEGFTANSTSILSRLLTGTPNANQAALFQITPGAEIINPTGDLTLASSWDLSTFRFGPNANPSVPGSGTPGVLTLRAAGNINIDFGASLTDGFAGSSYSSVLLAPGSQSWSYNITTGADFSASQLGAVQTTTQLTNSGLGGSLQVGVQNSASPIILSNSTTNDPNVFFQTIRTGTGNITIHSGKDVLLLNNLATIYTAGTQVDPTLGGTFTPTSGYNSFGQFLLPATYSTGGGNVAISAQGNIARETYSGVGNALVADSSAELPTNWLDREGSVSGGTVVTPTTWWVDFTNFFEGIGALGGGNVTLDAKGSITNIDAAVPTNARVVNGQLTELGGGDLVVSAGNNIDGGVYYIERGQGTLSAGNDILTNATRSAVPLGQPSTSIDWLPTTLFLGKGSFSVAAGGNLLLGPVANPFLLPQSFNNKASRTDLTSELSYFSTYASTDAVNASSLAGNVTIQDFSDGQSQGSLFSWYTNILDASVISPSPGSEVSDSDPWLLLAEASNPQTIITNFGPAGVLPLGSPENSFGGFTALLPPTLRVTAFSGDINLLGSLTLSPSSSGTVNLVAGGSINAFQVNSVINQGTVSSYWGSGLVNLSDTNPNALPSITSPISSSAQLASLDQLFTVTGATENLTLQTKQLLHDNINGQSLHANDPNPDPAYIYAASGDISGLTFFSAKQAQVIAGNDITDVGLYIQNNKANDISLIQAGRDIIAYDATSPLRDQAGTNLFAYDAQNDPLGGGVGAPNSGDLQISGPGTLEVLAGRDLTLGNDVGQNPNKTVSGDGLFTGLTSVGGLLNPALASFGGSNIVAAAGMGSGLASDTGLQTNSLGFGAFTDQFLNPNLPGAYSSTYLPELGAALGLTNVTNPQIWDIFSGTADTSLTLDEVKLQQRLTPELRNAYALDMFYLVLRDAGRDHNLSGSPGFGNYTAGNLAIQALFPASTYRGDINVTSREIKTADGGDINLLMPGGQLIVGVNQPNGQAVDQGILTVNGGNISIFANGDVSLGTSRIFTLHGGNEVIWSTLGNIDAGASSKTVVSAPPTRVVVDPTSGSVQTDLAGLATGGGIGVLASVVGALPGDVDLIAPQGTINAGDAGIRASGNLNISALKVVNADNISVGGKSSGVPATSSVNIGAVAAAAAAAGSSQAAAGSGAPNKQNVAENAGQDLPSIITVDVLGYGGGDED